MKNWEFDCQIEVNGSLRQVWTCPSDLEKNELFYNLTFDLGKGENPPKPRAGYWTHLTAFRKNVPEYTRNIS